MRLDTILDAIAAGDPVPRSRAQAVLLALEQDPWFDLALRVAELRDRNIGLHEAAAFGLVATATGSSSRTVTRAWSHYRSAFE